MKRATTFSAILLCAIHVLSCEYEGSLEIFLVRSPETQEDPLDPMLVTHLKILVTGADMEPEEKIFTFEPGEASEVPGTPRTN